MQYQIIQNLTWPCRVIDVNLKKNRTNNSKFIVVKLGKYDTGDFLRSVILSESKYNNIVTDMQTKKYHTIERIVISPQNCVYHILTWDDVDRGICTKEHIGEIQRDKDGSPILFNQIVVFAKLDNRNYFSINEILDKEYIEVNSPIVQEYINYNNQQHFWQQQDAVLRKRQEFYNQMTSDLYDTYEDRKYVEMDHHEWSEEDVWDAMTDGMYGDYPGGDVDYEKFGF